MGNKRAQEEIVGFVAIVVISVVIFIIFLGISLRKGNVQEQGESRDLRQFLESSMEYTSDCALDYEPNYASLGDLMNECYAKNRCASGRDACILLKEDMGKILRGVWKVGEDRSIKGYVFNASYTQNANQTDGEDVLVISEGNCTGSFTSSEYITPVFPRGNIISSFKLCT